MTMQIADIEREVRAFLVNNFLFGRADALQDEESLLGNVIDSTGTLELVMFLQDRFGITVEDDDIAAPDNFASIKSIGVYVAKKLGS